MWYLTINQQLSFWLDTDVCRFLWFGMISKHALYCTSVVYIMALYGIWYVSYILYGICLFLGESKKHIEKLC